MDRIRIKGVEHYGPFIARKTHDPNTGRAILEVIDDDDTVLVKDGDEYITFFAGAPIARKNP